MDSAVVNIILATQDQAYHDLIEIYTKQVDDKLQSMQATINQLTRRLEITQHEINYLKEKVRCQDQEIKCKTQENQELHAKLDSISSIMKDLQDKCNYYNRCNNLQFLGIVEGSRNEAWEQSEVKILYLLSEKLQLPNV